MPSHSDPAHHHPAAAPEGEPPPIGIHGMALLGNDPLYLSHLPMFGPPHNYQLLLEITLDPESLERVRAARPGSGDELWTISPEEFSLTDLVPTADAPAAVHEFRTDLVRGHFERGGEVVAPGALVTVTGVLHFHALRSGDRASELRYILLGRSPRTYLAHWITGPPDFDQLLAVQVGEHGFTDEELHRELSGVLITVPDRDNDARSRLRPGETVTGRGHVVGAHQFHDVALEVVAEVYFEEGELGERASFAPTAEEDASGFGGV